VIWTRFGSGFGSSLGVQTLKKIMCGERVGRSIPTVTMMFGSNPNLPNLIYLVRNIAYY